MSYRVVFTPRARADVVEAFRWLHERSPQRAARWYRGLDRAIASLAANPGLHPIAEEESAQLGLDLRQMLYGRRPKTYRVLYSIEGDLIYLHHIRHTARGPIEGDD